MFTTDSIRLPASFSVSGVTRSRSLQVMMVMMVVVVLLLPCVAASTCLRLLRNDRETRILRRKPDYVRRWNAITAEFENLEALTLNNSAFCSVDTVNDLRGKTLVVGIQRSVSDLRSSINSYRYTVRPSAPGR